MFFTCTSCSSSSAWTFLLWIHHSVCLWLGACVSQRTHIIICILYIYIFIYTHIHTYTYTYLHIDVMSTDTYQHVKIWFHIFAYASLTNLWLLLAGHDAAASARCNSFLLSLSPPLSALSETPGSWHSWACLGPNACHVCQNRCRIECPNRCQQVRRTSHRMPERKHQNICQKVC